MAWRKDKRTLNKNRPAKKPEDLELYISWRVKQLRILEQTAADRKAREAAAAAAQAAAAAEVQARLEEQRAAAEDTRRRVAEANARAAELAALEELRKKHQEIREQTRRDVAERLRLAAEAKKAEDALKEAARSAVPVHKHMRLFSQKAQLHILELNKIALDPRDLLANLNSHEWRNQLEAELRKPRQSSNPPVE